MSQIKKKASIITLKKYNEKKATNLNRVTKDISMSNKHTKIYSTSLIIREVKITKKCHFIHTVIAKNKTKQKTKQNR